MKGLIPILLLLSAMFLVACAQPEVQVMPPVPPVEDREIAAPEPVALPVVEPETEPELVLETQSAQDELEALLADAPEPHFMITYLNTASFNGTVSSAETTQYVSDEKFRADMSETIDGKKVNFRRFANGGFAECFREDDAEWHCIKYPESEAGSETQQSEEGEPVDEPETLVTRLPGRTIAGVPAKCFETRIILESITQEICYSDDGVMLFFRAEGPDGYSETKATQFSDSISPDAFVLPAEPELLTLD